MTPTIIELVARLDAAAIALDSAGSNPLTMQGGGVRSTLTPTRAKQYARAAEEAASALQGLQEEKKRAHAALKSIETMAGNMMFNIRQHGELTDADRVVRGLSDIEAVASRATREGGE